MFCKQEKEPAERKQIDASFLRAYRGDIPRPRENCLGAFRHGNEPAVHHHHQNPNEAESQAANEAHDRKKDRQITVSADQK
jgi:hypothetical protein